MCTMGLNTKSVWLSSHTAVSSCGGALRFYKSFRNKCWSLFFFHSSECFFKHFPFSQTSWPGSRKWLHVLWPAQLRGCRWKKAIFHKPLWFLHKKKYSFRVIVQVALHPAKINISLLIFSQAFLKVRCGDSNVIANWSYLHTNTKIRVPPCLYSHKHACTKQ